MPCHVECPQKVMQAPASAAHDGIVPVDGLTLARSSALVVSTLLLSYAMGDGQTSGMMLACLRATIQLMVLGQILVPIFRYGHDHWWVTLVYVLAMSLVAAHAAVTRPKYTYRGMGWHFFLSVGTVPCIVTVVVVDFVLRVAPLWEPQYCIPLSGMIFNNALTGAIRQPLSLYTSSVGIAFSICFLPLGVCWKHAMLSRDCEAC